ncbi:MAG TPA: type 4a pilus biogenesis protein PilO [Candidatus Cloacimonadota bacterium]|nr:type 4a pilus biogenesis protein PilO [Candidatus Cloacimonadota bacterium]HOV16696.1 type 4a pilus biogenesis protein PilO [Candidatus Cloacimonadota bacterium]HQL14628.1 type 4a pilus biogenesis protein PilO [Candidatus Cloacimonadota bacterium]
MKQRYIIFEIGMVVVAILFFVLSNSMIGNKLKKIDSLDHKIKIAQEKLNSAKIMNQQLSQFSLIIDNSLTKEKSFSAQEINAFVKSLADLADQNQIGVLAIYPKEVQTGLNLVEQQYIMELNSTYVELGQFLANLEAMDHIVKINTLDVMPLMESEATTKTKTGTLSAPKVARYKVALELSVFKVVKEA